MSRKIDYYLCKQESLTWYRGVLAGVVSVNK